jgi:hypothetical protein
MIQLNSQSLFSVSDWSKDAKHFSASYRMHEKWL